MTMRLMVRGARANGQLWEVWKDVDADSVPRTGDQVGLGTLGSGGRDLTDRTVVSVRWSDDLTQAEVRLSDLDPGWFAANEEALYKAGWYSAMA